MSHHDHAPATAPLRPQPQVHSHAHSHSHGQASAASTATHRHTERGGARPLPARSLLGAGLGTRLGVAAGALALLWLSILWALG
ncbi:MAG TPA: hypothetical protein PLF79_11195 [Thauera sp.]|nr:hypothetical protein [Thauera sp.]